MSYVMFPKVLEEYLENKTKYGPVSALDTRTFFVGPKIAESLNVYRLYNIIEEEQLKFKNDFNFIVIDYN